MSDVTPLFSMDRPPIPARFATVTASQSVTPETAARMLSCTCCVRSQMPGVGVTAFDSAVALSVVPTNRLSSKVYTVSLVRPGTV